MTAQKNTKTPQNLEDLFDEFLKEVEKDLKSKGSFWNPTFVTAAQIPNARTVVLRELEVPFFIIHTDIRSQKWIEVEQNPNTLLHFYCPNRRWQMKVTGLVEKMGESECKAEWAKISQSSKEVYGLPFSPGLPCTDPKTAGTPKKLSSKDEEKNSFENFGALRIVASEMESLQLASPEREGYHQRALWCLKKQDYSYLTP